MNSFVRIKEGKKGKREKRKGEKMVLQGRPQPGPGREWA